MNIDKTKIEVYTVFPKAPSVGIVYKATGIYNINNQNLTEAQVIVNFDLILDTGVFYTKPKVNILMNSGKSIDKKFVDDATMNSWVSTNLGSLAFLSV